MKGFKEIKELLLKSSGKPILLDGIGYSFSCKKKYTVLELNKWEQKYKIQLPKEYKLFLIDVGSCDIYMDDYGLGIKFHLLENIEDFTKEVFIDIDNPFPNLLLIGSNLNNGDIIGYNLKNQNENKLSIYSIQEEYPENWITIDKFISLPIFIEKLIKSEGENYYL